MAGPSEKTVKRLFALSRNRCAYPGCETPIVHSSGTITGEVCHIKAQSTGGPRFDSKQSDEARHMTLGLECIRFMLEQDPDNIPIVQKWIDKWFWRGYRVTALIAQMLDYMLPRKVMSWKEAFELYFEEQMLKGLFADLAFYGIKPPRHVDDAIAEKEILSHQVYWTLYQFSHAAAFTTSVPTQEHERWLSETYPETFDKHYKAMWDKEREGWRIVTGESRCQPHVGRMRQPGPGKKL